MHGPTCVFWVNLTPFSLQARARVQPEASARAADPPHGKDKAGLLGFKASGNGAGLESWTEKSDPCADAWAGVTCADDGHTVTELALSTYINDSRH